MLSYVHLEPPVIINVAGGHRLSGVGKGILIVEVEGQQGIKHLVQLPVTIVPGLGRHLFSAGTAATKIMSMVIAARSYLDLGNFKVNSRTGKKYSTLTYSDLTIAPSSIATESAFPKISGNMVKPKTVMSANMAMTTSSTQVTDTNSRKYFCRESPAV